MYRSLEGMKLIKRKMMTYEDYRRKTHGEQSSKEKKKQHHASYRRNAGPDTSRASTTIDTRLAFNSAEALQLLNDAIGTIASAKITEELAKADYKESKKLVLETFAETVQVSKEELAAIVKVAEAKARDKILDLDGTASAVLKVLDYDLNSVPLQTAEVLKAMDNEHETDIQVE